MKSETMTSLIIKSNELHGEIKSQSTGTDQYHVFSMFGDRIVCTDGIIEMATENKCFWFLDVVVSYFGRIKRMMSQDNNLVVCRIVKNLTGNGCVFIVDDGNNTPLITQRIPYTDLKSNLRTYLQYDGTRLVLFMPSEY